ncbi:hypothetical protein FK220_011415 [Flavobacteriaceae bacterium TP-CH-4]|uniref:MORN repeat-containing protein n=1 Tax=Pelagihabitans pacificus TaxID=2696054 RepID=A0A967AVP9_9FLAO|nr:hypothetical protein [Pelagihabitans pacificus]NHF59953.1 hypothetical protein [Pelagihabitans pacificus]
MTNKRIPYIVAFATTVAAAVLVIKSQDLKRKLEAVNTDRALLQNKLQAYQQFTNIDSLLLKGDYQTAVNTYRNTADFESEQKGIIPLRIALAERLLAVKTKERQFRVVEEKNVDSATAPENISPMAARKYDSLSFVLEKAKVKLARAQRQLKAKSFGEYLTFKNSKGHVMHYVGQVKNHKANGYGIAILDTGGRYEGTWKDNERDGEGTYYWPDGEYYVGGYRNDKRNGFGTYYWPNGEKYAGQWKEDKRSGSGEFFGTDGDMVTGGVWNDDKLVQTDKKGRR